MQGSFGGRVEKFKKDKKDNREEFRNKNDDRKRSKVKRGKRPEDDVFNDDKYWYCYLNMKHNIRKNKTLKW